MIKKVEQFPFYITYMDIDEYCFWLMNTYGENAAFVDVIDRNGFMDQCDNPQIYKKNADVLLLEMRQCLIDNGFEAEVNACDKAFSDESRIKRGKVNPYIPLNKRWKNDKFK